VAGADFSQILGSSNEILFSGPNQARSSGGRQRRLSWFGEDIFHGGSWNVILGARVDDWKNYRGSILTIPNSGASTPLQYPARSNLALSPRLSVLRSLAERLAVTASIYRAFELPPERALPDVSRGERFHSQQPFSHSGTPHRCGGRHASRPLRSTSASARDLFLERHR